MKLKYFQAHKMKKIYLVLTLYETCSLEKYDTGEGTQYRNMSKLK